MSRYTKEEVIQSGSSYLEIFAESKNLREKWRSIIEIEPMTFGILLHTKPTDGFPKILWEDEL